MKQLLRYIMLMILVAGSACSEGFLDIDQRGAIAEEDFYLTDEQALEALMAVYDNLQAIPYNLLNVLNAMSDESYAGGGQRGDNGGMLEELNEFRSGPTNTTITNLFFWCYAGIYRTNKLIDRVLPDTPDKILIIAQARFLRAFYYFYLVTLWGDVPLILHELEPDQYAQPRSDAGLVWEQIGQDLEDAMADLPVRSELPEMYQNLASRGTAEAWLGKCLLFQEQFDEAAYHFDQVISSMEYDLCPAFDKVLRPETENGTESLFEIAYTTDKNYQAFGGSESNNWLIFTSPRETFFESGELKILEGWGFLNPRETLYQAFIIAGDSVRLTATLISEQDLIGRGGELRNAFNDLPYGNEGYVRIKYVLYMDDGGPPSPKYNNGTNIRMLRFADVLLMAAEAHNRKDMPDDGKALQYINRVRQRARLDPLSIGGDTLFEAIKHERRLELCFEFVRYQDLLRWGEAAQVLQEQGKQIPVGNGEFYLEADAGFETGKHELLPIPEQEMYVNPYMVQNPGY